MKLQDQCCLLEQAKRLKELGVIQQSVACFIGEELHLFEKSFYNWAEQKNLVAVAAFTVAELGAMLPSGYDTMHATNDGWRCFDLDGIEMREKPFETEAESRAHAIIKLIESDAVAVGEVNERLLNS